MTEYRTIRKRGASMMLTIPATWENFQVGDGVKMDLSEDGKMFVVSLIE